MSKRRKVTEDLDPDVQDDLVDGLKHIHTKVPDEDDISTHVGRRNPTTDELAGDVGDVFA